MQTLDSMGLNVDIKKGFTMIELIMVMGILAVTSTFVVLNFQGSQTTARDTQRRSDLKQYHTALEVYANNHEGVYVSSGGSEYTAQTDLCSVLALTGTCPIDSKDNTGDCLGHTCRYYYRGTLSTFVLYSALEKNSSGAYFVICGNGTTGYSSTAPTTVSCPI